MKKRTETVCRCCILLLLSLGVVFFSACTQMMGSAGGTSGGRAEITREAIESYLKEYGLNAPGLAPRIAVAMRNGDNFKDRVKDSKGNYVNLTVWVDRKSQDVFCILFYRDETCPECNGTGKKQFPSFMDTKVAGIARSCTRCNGTGVLKNQKHQRCWMLSASDFKNPEQATRIQRKNELKNAPPETDNYVHMLGSSDPQERLDACVWLDRNYVRPGINFREIMPIIERARYSGPVVDNSLTTKIMGKRIGEGMNVYQFWAGKGIKKEWRKAYWRVFIENKSGNVVKTEFASERPPKSRRKK